MNLIYNFINKFEATKKVFYFVLPIVGLSLFYLQTDNAEVLSFVKVPKEYIFKADEILILGLIVTFLLELFQILAGSRIQLISNFIKKILGFIISTMNSLFNFLYTKPLSKLIRPGVKKILEEYGFYSVERSFIFLTQEKGKRYDDHYFPEILELSNGKTVKVRIIPKSSGRWRFGFIFSQDRHFPHTRYDKDHPLFHLTKDQEESSLGVHYYKGTSHKPSFHKLWSNYNNEETTIDISNSDRSTNVMVSPIEEGKAYNTIIGKQQYFKIFAWADGITTFQIDAKIQIITFELD